MLGLCVSPYVSPETTQPTAGCKPHRPSGFHSNMPTTPPRDSTCHAVKKSSPTRSLPVIPTSSCCKHFNASNVDQPQVMGTRSRTKRFVVGARDFKNNKKAEQRRGGRHCTSQQPIGDSVFCPEMKTTQFLDSHTLPPLPQITPLLKMISPWITQALECPKKLRASVVNRSCGSAKPQQVGSQQARVPVTKDYAAWNM